MTRVYARPVNLSSEFRNAVEKLSNGRMELMFVPAGATGRYQVNDTHLHKPLKDYARKLVSLWLPAESSPASTWQAISGMVWSPQVNTSTAA